MAFSPTWDPLNVHIKNKKGWLKLVGGFNPVEKYDRQNGFIFRKDPRENKKNIWNDHLVKLLLWLGNQPP